ncbi:MAG: hypothetical protein GXO19_03340 [Epsilonproteobacteria bacterium]|nr:hypothetical protein [Campylobacterota bacterium]NPA56752.1 hypothetical protein [Campylobacterota bacterium]
MCSERIRERLANLREYFRALVLLSLAVATGIVANIYQIIIQKVPPHSLVIATVGLTILVRLLFALSALTKKMEELEGEIKCS